MSGRATRPPRLGVGAFLALQGVLVLALGLWLADVRRSETASRALPALRQRPLLIGPLHDDPEVVGDEELERALARLQVRFAGAATPVARIEHALRLRGSAARFASTESAPPFGMLRLLVDHGRFAGVYGRQQAPLLIDAGPGVRVRVGEGAASSSHVDHALAALLEIGLELDYPVRTPAAGRTLRALVEQSLRDFRLDQPEVEWSVLAYALTLEPTAGWRAGDGQRLSFGRLAARLMREELPNGVCSANHRLHTLVVLLRADGESGGGLLSGAERDSIAAFLAERTAELVAHQHADGFWNFDWPRAAPESAAPGDREGDTLGDRIIVTGHVLEWWALAPEALLPPRDSVRRAGSWLVATIGGLDEAKIQEYSSFLSHAGRALALWRGRAQSGAGAPHQPKAET